MADQPESFDKFLHGYYLIDQNRTMRRPIASLIVLIKLNYEKDMLDHRRVGLVHARERAGLFVHARRDDPLYSKKSF